MTYTESVIQAGGTPILISITTDSLVLTDIANRLDGDVYKRQGLEIKGGENKGMKRHFSFLIFHSLLKYGFFAKIISLVKELCFSL